MFGLESVLRRRHLAIPALGEHRAPGAQVQTGHVLGLAVGHRRHADQFGGGIVAGITPQRNRVLAGHHRIVADLVARRIGHITGGIDRAIALDLEVAVDMQAALAVAFATDLLGERVGLEAHGPDHGLGRDALAIVQQHPIAID
ncbi:hypothetical protein D3C80_1588750 [compost metagenome]